MPKAQPKKKLRPAQHQNRQPGLESAMRPKPQAEGHHYRGSGKP